MATASMTGYVSTTAPILEGGDSLYVNKQFDKVEKAINSLQTLCPQAATKLPSTLLDGMQRLARSPWWPVAGQTKDAWVYYDATVSAWKYLNA